MNSSYSSVHAELQPLSPGDNFDAPEVRSALPSYLRTTRVVHLTGASGHRQQGWRPAVSACFTPDGRRLVVATSSDRRVRIFEADREYEEMHSLREDGALDKSALCMSIDGLGVWEARQDGNPVRLRSTETGEELVRLKDFTGAVRSMSLSADGTLLATSARDKFVRVWDTASGEPVHVLEHDDWVDSVEFSPNPGSHLLVCAYSMRRKRPSNMLWQLWDVDSEACLISEQVQEEQQPPAEERKKRTVTRETCNTCVFTPDGTRIVTGGSRGLQVWQIASRALVHRIATPRSVDCVAMFPDGVRVATAGEHDRVIRVWDTEAKECLHSLMGHTSGVVDLRVSPDGALLASASGDKTARLWNADQGICVANLGPHPEKVNGVCFSHDGGRLASYSGQQKGSVHVWGLDAGGHCTRILDQRAVGGDKSNRSSIVRGGISPDGKWIVTGHDVSLGLCIWNTLTGECVRPSADDAHTEQVRYVLFARNSEFFVTGGLHGSLKAWKPSTGECLYTTQPFESLILAVSLSGDGKCVAVGCDGCTSVALLNATTGEPATPAHLQCGEAGERITSLEFAPQSGARLLAVGAGQHVYVFDYRTAAPKHILGDDLQLSSVMVRFSPDGCRLASSTEHGSKVHLWNPSNGTHVADIDPVPRSKVKDMCFSPDSKRLAINISANKVGHVWIWDCRDKVVFKIIDQTGTFFDVAYSPDGKQLATAHYSQVVKLWSIATGECVNVFKGHTSTVFNVHFAPSGDWLASFDGRDSVRVWDIDPGATPTIDELLLRRESSAEFAAFVRAFPFVLERRSRVDSDELRLFAGESVLHMLARAGDDELLAVLFEEPEPLLNALQSGPHGSPLFLAAEARNDACVRTLLRDVVRRCNEADDWHVYNHELANVLPILARDFGRDLTLALQDMRLPTAPYQDVYVAEDCANVAAMSLDECFRTGTASYTGARGLWASYFRGSVDSEESLSARAQRALGLTRVREVGDSGTDVVGKVVPLRGVAGPSHIGKPPKQHPIGALVQYGLVDAVGAPVVRHMLEFKWNRYARSIFVRGMCIYMLMLGLFTTATVQDECYDVDATDLWSIVRGANDVVVVLLALYHVRFEARQVSKEGVKGYLANVWNMLDVVGLLLVLVLIPFRIFCWDHASTLQSVAAVCLWLKLLDFFRAFRTTGPFVRMIFRIASAIGFFLVVLLVVMLAFSHGFYLLFRGVLEVQTGEAGGASDFGTWWVLLKVYSIVVFGEFDRTELALARSEPLAVVYGVAFSVFATILMLNLLIALMSSVYSEVEQNVDNEWMIERAQIVLDIDEYMDRSELSRKNWFPEWVHVLEAKYREVVVQDVTNRAAKAEIIAEVKAHVDATLDATNKSVDGQLQDVHGKLQEMREQLATVVQLLQAQADADEAKVDE